MAQWLMNISSPSMGELIPQFISKPLSNVHIRPLNEDDIDCMFASCCAGMTATMVGHPIDSIKVRIQMAGSTNEGILRTMISMVKQEGIMPFYRGVFPPTVVKAITTMAFYTMNNYIKDNIIIQRRNNYIARNEPVPDQIRLSLMETAAVAGFCGFMLFPFISTGELIKIQLQMDKNLEGRPTKYKNMIDCTRTLLRYRQLHRGMLITSMRLIPGWGVYLLVYDAFNRYYDEKAVLGNNETLGSWTVSGRVILGGSIAGSVAWMSSYPPDYIKTQIQAHQVVKWNYIHTQLRLAQPPRIRDVASMTIQKYGFLGFFRGLSPCLVRAVPVNMTNFWVYETVLQLKMKRRQSRGD